MVVGYFYHPQYMQSFGKTDDILTQSEKEIPHGVVLRGNMSPPEVIGFLFHHRLSELCRDEREGFQALSRAGPYSSAVVRF